MKRIASALFALSLLAGIPAGVAAQDSGTKQDSGAKADAKATGHGAAQVGKSTGRIALSGTKKGFSKAGSALSHTADKLDKKGSKDGSKTTNTSSTNTNTGKQ